MGQVATEDLGERHDWDVDRPHELVLVRHCVSCPFCRESVHSLVIEDVEGQRAWNRADSNLECDVTWPVMVEQAHRARACVHVDPTPPRAIQAGSAYTAGRAGWIQAGCVGEADWMVSTHINVEAGRGPIQQSGEHAVLAVLSIGEFGTRVQDIASAGDSSGTPPRMAECSQPSSETEEPHVTYYDINANFRFPSKGCGPPRVAPVS